MTRTASHRLARRLAAAAGLAAAGFGGLAACGGGGGEKGRAGEPVVLGPSDFVAPMPEPDPGAGPTTRPVGAGGAVAARDVSEAMGGLGPGVGEPGAPGEPGERAGRPELGAGDPAVRERDRLERLDEPVRVLVDQRVGQVNGTPVFAEEFFEDLEARLRAEAARMGPDEWARSTFRVVERRLAEYVTDQILLGEFQATLTPQERMGLLAYVDNIRTNLRNLAGGSERRAEQRLLETEGMTLEEKVRDQADVQLIREQLRRAIANKVYVSSRDIERYYERNFDEFNPPPTAVLRVLSVPASDEAAVSAAESALAAGEPFERVASEYSTWRPGEGNIQEVVLTGRDYASAQLWAPEELNGPTRALELGEHTGKIEFGSSVWWVRLDEIREAPGVTLYEAQEEIRDRLRGERLLAERSRYLEGLIERSNVSDRREMIEALVAYATERFYLEDRLLGGGDAGEDATGGAGGR